MKNLKNKGFTLLELLVVIAIIGILAAIIVGQIQTGRERAKDKAIAENLLTVRNEAQIYFTNTGTYGTYGVTGAGATATPTTGNNGKCPAAFITGATVGAFNLSGNANSIKIQDAIREAVTQSGPNAVTILTGTNMKFSNSRCIASSGSFASAVSLATDTSKAWCVDSNGYSGEINIDVSNNATAIGAFVNDGTGRFVCVNS